VNEIAPTEKVAIAAHKWAQQPENWYLEPEWTSRRLFDEERFFGSVYDPCAGIGRILQSARAAGLDAIGSDIVDRGGCGGWIRDFVSGPIVSRHPTARNIVSNPPFEFIREVAERACAVAPEKVALLAPCRRLVAAGEWLQKLPLSRILYLTPRPSMPPGETVLEIEARGKKPSGGTQDFCWIIFQHGYRGEPRVGWLNREKGNVNE
jgi:hypothetical protein